MQKAQNMSTVSTSPVGAPQVAKPPAVGRAPELQAAPATSKGSAESKGATPLVVARDLTKRFGRVDAVDGITLEIPRGQIVGLVGPNGSGKSTFLKLITGLLRPDRGEVLVAGMRPGLATKRLVAYEPEGDCLYDWMTVHEAMEFVAVQVPDWDDEKAGTLLAFLNLRDQLATRIRNLSKGMRARVKLLVALSRNAPLTLLDEPLSGIDPTSRLRIIQSLVSEFRLGEQTIVLSTHEVAETEGIFDRVIFLERGQVKIDGDAQELRSRYGCSIQRIFEQVYA